MTLLCSYWFRFEVKVDGANHKLIIKDAHLDDADEYTAQIGDETSIAKLTVQGKTRHHCSSARQQCGETQLLR